MCVRQALSPSPVEMGMRGGGGRVGRARHDEKTSLPLRLGGGSPPPYCSTSSSTATGEAGRVIAGSFCLRA